MEKLGQGPTPHADRAAESYHAGQLVFQETKRRKNYFGSESAQPFEKARFVEGDNLDFPSTCFDFPSPRAWIFLP